MNSADYAKRASKSVDWWIHRYVRPDKQAAVKRTDWFRALKALERETAKTGPAASDEPQAVPAGGGGARAKPAPGGGAGSPFGTAGDAGPFSGRGIMLGSNPEVWEQALGLIRGGYVDVVAPIPGPQPNVGPARVVTWDPPWAEPHDADLHQAENPDEWEIVKGYPNLIVNDWAYGNPGEKPEIKAYAGKVVLAEFYANENPGEPDFNYFTKMVTVGGARCVIPLLGGWASTQSGRTNQQVADWYSRLHEWGKIHGPFPGVWWYAGESPLTPESVEVLKAWT